MVTICALKTHAHAKSEKIIADADEKEAQVEEIRLFRAFMISLFRKSRFLNTVYTRNPELWNHNKRAS